MSKSLKKLIDINRLREFKNKLVGTDSDYVQTGAVDQTVAGTKTFSKPIVGSVTGSSGSCTGNAASADRASAADCVQTNDHHEIRLDWNSWVPGYVGLRVDAVNMGGIVTTNIASSAYVQTGAVDQTVDGTKTFSEPIVGSVTGSSGSCTGNAASANIATKADSATKAANADHATKADSATNATYANWLRTSSHSDHLFHAEWDGACFWTYVTDGNGVYRPVRVARSDSAANADHATSADSATNATYANWLRTSSHTDHLFHTEWDNAGYFWTYVTDGNGGYRPVRVARSDSSGNADTATKLATARTVALSGAVTGTATAFDGSGNITIPVTALAASAIRAQWYAAYPDGAEAHNAMWGGRDITAAFNNGTVSANIANGTFRDIFPGDYITKQVTIGGTAYTVNWVIADCDYWINKGDTPPTAHHVAIVPQVPIFSANMNNDNVTTGGYFGSRMYRETIPACAMGIANAFGSDHILAFRDGITNSVDTSHVSSGIPQWTGTPGWWGMWGVVCCNLMSEKMVYGAPICAAGAMDNSVATRQMSAFRLSEWLINYNRGNWWLRDVVSSAYFAYVDGYGLAAAAGASTVLGVRPFALLK